jgi:hypothetical protein
MMQTGEAYFAFLPDLRNRALECPGSPILFLNNWHQDDRSRGGARVLIIQLNRMESAEMRRNERPSRCVIWSHQRNGHKESGSLSFS